jgi:hypothetical protein
LCAGISPFEIGDLVKDNHNDGLTTLGLQQISLFFTGQLIIDA